MSQIQDSIKWITPKVHTICIFHKHMCAQKPLQFGKMWKQGQLRSMRKPCSSIVDGSSDSIEVFLLQLCAISVLRLTKISLQLTFNDGSVSDLLEERLAYLEGHLAFWMQLVEAKAGKCHLGYVQKRNIARVKEALLKFC